VLALIHVFAESASADVTQAVAEAKNPILPVMNEMFWTLVFFAILWALMKFVLLPPVMRTFKERAEMKRREVDQKSERDERETRKRER